MLFNPKSEIRNLKHERAAVLDIGSHSVLLLIAHYEAQKGWQPLLDLTRITRLGEGFEPNKHLQLEAIERTLQAIDEYLQIIKKWKLKRILAIGTGVLREAQNSEAFVSALRERRLELRILSEEEEARLSFASVRYDPQLEEGDSLAVIDIGGGSVEVAVGEPHPPTPSPEKRGGDKSLSPRRGERETGSPLLVGKGLGVRSNPATFSFPWGAIKVREQLLKNDPPTHRDLLNACVQLDQVFAPLTALPQPACIATVGGTGVNLASVWLGLDSFDPARLHGYRLEYEHLGRLLECFCSMPAAERRQIKGLEPERAAVIHAGALLLERVLHALRQDFVLISVRGLRYGVLCEEVD